jgi:protein SCO1/2
MNRRTLLAGLGVAPFAGALLQQDAYATAHTKADSNARFPNPVMTTHEGKKVRFYGDLVKGKTVMVNFMFAACGDVCPGMTANLARVQKLLGDRVGRDVHMYSISLQPEHDTPLVLKTYAEGYHVKPGWTFLTGARTDIEALRRSLGLFDTDPAVDADREQHIGMVVIGNDKLDRWMACPALSVPERIARTVDWMNPQHVNQRAKAA